jgi:hypothetical protein
VNYSGAVAVFSRGWRVPEAALLWSTGHCPVYTGQSGVHRTVRCTPDSPVNYSGVPLEIPEGGKFELESSGASDIVRCPRPEVPSVAPLLLC